MSSWPPPPPPPPTAPHMRANNGKQNSTNHAVKDNSNYNGTYNKPAGFRNESPYSATSAPPAPAPPRPLVSNPSKFATSFRPAPPPMPSSSNISKPQSTSTANVNTQTGFLSHRPPPQRSIPAAPYNAHQMNSAPVSNNAPSFYPATNGSYPPPPSGVPPPPAASNAFPLNPTFQARNFHTPAPPPMQRPPPAQSPYPLNPTMPTTQAPAPSRPLPKINPAQIPRPPSFNHPQHQPAQIHQTRYSLETTTLPPSASSRFISIDDGNASSRLIRPTIHHIPCHRSLLDKTGLPFAIMVSPLSPPDGKESIPPLLNGKTPLQNNNHNNSNGNNNGGTDIHGEERQLPLKCSRCNAYLNPFVKWGDGSSSNNSMFGNNSSIYNTYHCNFCGYENSVKDAPPISSMKKGTVEYLVDGPYIPKNGLVRNIHLYALDLTNCMFPNQGEDSKIEEEPALWKEYLRSMTDVAEGLNDMYEQELQQRIWSIEGEVEDKYKPHMGVCLILPDKTVTIPYLRCKQDQWEMQLATMSDIQEDPFSPLPTSSWTFNVTLDTDMKQFHFLMSSIDSMLKKDLQPDSVLHRSCGGSALAAMVNALSETGGRATLITSTRPSLGVGAIANREKLSFLYTRPLEEHNVCTPIQNLTEKNENFGKHDKGATFYRKLEEECQKTKVSLDIFVLSGEKGLESYVDAATLSELCRSTCGKYLMIPHFKMTSPIGEILREELVHSITKNVGYDAILKVRCSSGFTLKSYLDPPGKVFDDGIRSPELELSCISTDTGICSLLEYQTGGIKKRGNQKLLVNVQSVLLYTTPFGQRKLRISTLTMPSTDLVSDVYRGADFGCIAAVLTREIVSNARVNGLKSARQYIVESCINMLSQYRLNTSAKDSPSGQLILPEALQLLPLFVMCLRKSVLLRSAIPVGSSLKTAKSPQPSVDERMHAMFHASNISSSLAMLLVHPNIYELTRLKGREGFEYTPQRVGKSVFMEEACKSYVQFPTTCHPSISRLEDESMYLIDDGFSFYLYIGKNVPHEVMLEVFGDSKYPVEGILSSTEYGKRVHFIIKALRGCCNTRPTFPPLIVYKSGDGNGDKEKQKVHNKIMTLLVDDATSQDKGYVDFLCALHKKIKERIRT